MPFEDGSVKITDTALPGREKGKEAANGTAEIGSAAYVINWESSRCVNNNEHKASETVIDGGDHM